MKNIFHIISYLFEEYLIISLSKEWISLFNCLPEFEGKIRKDGKLHLVSKQIVKKLQREKDNKEEDWIG